MSANKKPAKRVVVQLGLGEFQAPNEHQRYGRLEFLEAIRRSVPERLNELEELAFQVAERLIRGAR